MLAAAFLLAFPFALGQSDIPLSKPIQDVLTSKDDLYTYPTDFTQGIIPKNIHSHNDYWRPKPFYSALSVGAASVEADVWLYNGTLYVGHEESALTHARTFDALYIQPILSVLKKQNPQSPFVTAPTKNGVFDTAASLSLNLFVDVKTDGSKTWPYVVQALKPLRELGYLTNFDGNTVKSSCVTVIGTGNTPLDWFQSNNSRDYFYDAHLVNLTTTERNITGNQSPVASGDFGTMFGEVRNGILNSTQLATLRDQIATAKSRGIGARYWNTPGWPVGTRNAIWRLLYNEGVILINADDLEAAANFWENSG